MDQMEVRGAALALEEAGEGEPVVFVHGSVSDLRTWFHLLPRFAARYRAIAYSRRYHWPNARIPSGADYDMREHAEDLAAFLRAVDARPAHVVAHSYGAYVALLLAMDEPQAVRSLVLAEPPALPLLVSVPPKVSALVRLLITRPRTAAQVIRFAALGVGPATVALKRGDRETAIRRFGPAVLGKTAFEALSDERRSWVRDNLIDAELTGSGFPPIDETRLKRLDVPTLLLGSTRSPRLFSLILDRLGELIPGAERAEIVRASHIMHEDNPDTFFDTTFAFLNRVRSSDEEGSQSVPQRFATSRE
jgi:pimeloyl-ACP methyl ester carboxylesterase